MKTFEISTELYDQALSYLIAEYGLFSHAVDQFYKLGRRTYASYEYAVKHGFIEED